MIKIGYNVFALSTIVFKLINEQRSVHLMTTVTYVLQWS